MEVKVTLREIRGLGRVVGFLERIKGLEHVGSTTYPKLS